MKKNSTKAGTANLKKVIVSGSSSNNFKRTPLNAPMVRAMIMPKYGFDFIHLLYQKNAIPGETFPIGTGQKHWILYNAYT